MDLKLDAPGVERLICQGLVAAGSGGMKVEELRSGYARIRLPFNAMMIRPGNVISGPALFTAADSAMYALVLGPLGRSEEHTSELQSLMRISYAVFCLKKKK